MAEAPDSPDPAVREFVAGLSPEQRMLVLLKRELYAGSWDDMLADLNARLQGRPYVFKLADRIGDDIARIGQLRQFEQDHDVDLSDWVSLEG